MPEKQEPPKCKTTHKVEAECVKWPKQSSIRTSWVSQYRPKYAHTQYTSTRQMPNRKHTDARVSSNDRDREREMNERASASTHRFQNVAACCPKVSLRDTFVKRMFYPNEQYRCVCFGSCIGIEKYFNMFNKHILH